MDKKQGRKVKGYLDRVLILLMLIGISSWFLILPEDRLWSELGYSLLIGLSVPLILLAVIYDRYFPILENMDSRWRWIETLLVAPITGIFYVAIVVFYANWFNAVGDHPMVSIESEILEKRSHPGRPFPTYGFVVLVDGKKSEVPVNSQIYNKASIGDFYTTQMRRGNLGYYYQARWNKSARIGLSR